MFSYFKTRKVFPELENKKSYDSEDIYKQLLNDCSNKCYLCGEVIPSRSWQIEHFIPHEQGKYIDKQYDWTNLLLSCNYCNSKKSDSYNKIGANKDIFHPNRDLIEIEISHFYDPITDENVILLNNNGSSIGENTIELLEKIYNLNGVSSKSFKMRETCKELKKSIEIELEEFKSNIKSLTSSVESKERVELINNIKKALDSSATFYEFKVGLISMAPLYKKILDDHDISF